MKLTPQQLKEMILEELSDAMQLEADDEGLAGAGLGSRKEISGGEIEPLLRALRKDLTDSGVMGDERLYIFRFLQKLVDAMEAGVLSGNAKALGDRLSGELEKIIGKRAAPKAKAAPKVKAAPKARPVQGTSPVLPAYSGDTGVGGAPPRFPRPSVSEDVSLSTLKSMIAEEIESYNDTTLLNEHAEWVQPLLAMVAPMLGYHLYNWFAKQGEPEPRRRPSPPPGRPLREGMELPDVPQELIDQIPNDPMEIEAALAQELNLSAQGLEEFTAMIQQLIANR